jgi:hypothetical protein
VVPYGLSFIATLTMTALSHRISAAATTPLTVVVLRTAIKERRLLITLTVVLQINRRQN